MLKIYGTDLCPDCTACIAAFREAGIAYEYLKFETDLAHLREFLQLRDKSPLFDEIRAAGGIGIPCILREDGSITLDWQACL